MQTPSPIFIVGANRSGTTLLRLILNAHPRIAIPEELNFFNPWMAAHWRDAVPDRDAFRRRVHWYLHEKMPPGAFTDIALSDLENAIVSGASTYDWRALYAGALEAWARHHGKVRWGEKTPGNLFYVDLLREMFPEAQFIHLVRDPRAGVQSMQNASFFGDDVTINALNRRKYLREGLGRDATMPPDQWIRVRYEDLLTAPDETVQALCHFLGEPFVPAMLTYYEDAEQYMSEEAARGFNQEALRPIDPSKADSWRNTLPRPDATVIETVCRSEMSALSYVPDAPRRTLLTRMRILLTLTFWHLSQLRCDSPEYVVGESPTGYLRRIPSRLRSAMAALLPAPLSSDASSPK